MTGLKMKKQISHGNTNRPNSSQEMIQVLEDSNLNKRQQAKETAIPSLDLASVNQSLQMRKNEEDTNNSSLI